MWWWKIGRNFALDFIVNKGIMDLKGFRNMAATLVLGLMAAGVSAQTNKSDTTSVAKLERILSRFWPIFLARARHGVWAQKKNAR